MPTPARTLAATVLGPLRALADDQAGVLSVRQVLDAGVGQAQLATLIRQGRWAVVRRGVVAEVTWATEELPHRVACAARLLVTGEEAVVSHASAALLHGLPYVDLPREPTLSVPRLGSPRQLEGLFTSRVPAGHREDRDGLPVTTVGRTVADLLRTARDAETAQALADGARRFGLAAGAVEAVLSTCSRWPGVVQAREAWATADGRRESPLESRCAVWFRANGLPEPEPQVLLGDGTGFLARVDFFFRQQRTVVEADGRVKYTEPRALWEEKRREDRLREMGLEVVRATWADGDDRGADLVRRVLAAFARAARRTA